MDIVERLREDAEYHRWVSYDADCSPEATINHKHHVNALEAADEIERLNKMNNVLILHDHSQVEEIERLREALQKIAEVEGGDIDVIWREMRGIARAALKEKE